MARHKVHIGVAYGTGEFPFDMLRYDACWPHSTEDAVQIPLDRLSSRTEPRAVVVVSTTGTFTPARWESFGWKFKECSDYEATKIADEINLKRTVRSDFIREGKR